MAIVTLAEEFGFCPMRCKRFWDALQKNSITYNDALGWENKKAMRTGQTEFLRDRMDEKLKSALGEHYAEDFEGRYEYARDVKL